MLGSHSSLRSDSLGLDLSTTAHSGVGGLGTGREENINFLSDLSGDDDEDDGDGPQVRGICISDRLSLRSYDLSLCVDRLAYLCLQFTNTHVKDVFLSFHLDKD